MLVNGVLSSYVHLTDPSRLEFEYVQWTARLLDAMAPPGQPVDAVHLGGAGCALPLYLASTRPGTRQIVFELDAALVTLARQAFGLRSVRGLRLKVGDGRAGLATLDDQSADVVIRDAFDQQTVPAHLTTAQFYTEVARVLRPDGIYVANVSDNVKVGEARAEAATAATVFEHLALVAEPGQFRGRRFGNVLVLASRQPLPEDALVRLLAGGAVRARYVETTRVHQLISGVKPRFDATPEVGPVET